MTLESDGSVMMGAQLVVEHSIVVRGAGGEVGEIWSNTHTHTHTHIYG